MIKHTEGKIKFCPNCKGELAPSGGVKKCLTCKGKYYILETSKPELSEMEIGILVEVTNEQITNAKLK